MAVALIDRSGRRWPAMWRARCGRISQQIAALAPLLTSPHVYAQPMPLPMPITYNQALFTGRDTITTLLARAVTPLTVFTVSAHSPLDAAARGCAVTCTAASPTTAIAARAQTSPHSRALGDFPLSLPAPQSCASQSRKLPMPPQLAATPKPSRLSHSTTHSTTAAKTPAQSFSNHSNHLAQRERSRWLVSVTCT